MRRATTHWVPVLGIGAAVLACGEPAFAAGPLAPQGQPLATSSYSIDLVQGPVLAGSRMTGLAGAYAPIAEGADGIAFNAAAPAVRSPWSTDKVDYDLSGGVIFPSSLSSTDFDNNGTRGFTYDNFVFLTGGAFIQVDNGGIGASANLQQYDLGHSASATATAIPNGRLRLATGHFVASYGLFDSELLIGGGVRVAVLALVDASSASEKLLLQMTGVGPELGAIWAPRRLPLRVGLTARYPVKGEADLGNRTQPDANGDTRINGLFLPQQIELPWEIEGGIAVQFGRRALNLGWTDVRSVSKEELVSARRPNERESETAHRIARAKYASYPREKLLVTTSVLVTGPVSDGVGFESFLAQRVDRSGLRATISPRIGIEGEPYPNWLQIRGGAYIEPSRFVQSSPRLHETVGFDQKLFEWTVFGLFPEGTAWRAGGVADLARDYFGWGAVVGIWR